MVELNIDESKVVELLRSGKINGWWNNPQGGKYLQEFEKRFAEFVGTKYAIAVSGGTASIYVALRACGVGYGDYVALSPYTHIGSLAPIIMCGAIPVFVDVDEFGNIDPVELDKVIKDFDLKAILAAHQIGYPCRLEDIGNEEIKVVEDCSQSLGAEYMGFQVGSLGDIGCFSVGGDMAKTISTGEGGVITSNSLILKDRCQNIRNHGDKAGANYPCFNFRLAEINALIGLLQMDTLRYNIGIQRDNAKHVIDNLPPHLSVEDPLPETNPAYYIIGCWFLEEEKGFTRDEFLEEIRESGLDLGEPRRNISGGYSKLLYDIPYYAQFKRKCPNAELLRDNVVWIDFHRPPITIKDIDDKLLKTLNDMMH